VKLLMKETQATKNAILIAGGQYCQPCSADARLQRLPRLQVGALPHARIAGVVATVGTGILSWIAKAAFERRLRGKL
jgi:hypothetical protein